MKVFKRLSKEDMVFLSIVYSFLAIVAVMTAYPFLHTIARSLSSYSANALGEVSIFPVDFQLNTYEYIFTELAYGRAFLVSLGVTAVGTLLCLILVSLTAYPLAYSGLRWRKFLILFFVLPMFINPGFIPNYLLMRSLGLLNKYIVMVIPLLLLPITILIVKNFYESIPTALMESAEMDGASEFTILWKIITPISKPILATITIFMGVSYWNNFTFPLLYVSDAAKQPLPIFLYRLIQVAQNPPIENLAAEYTGELAVYAAAIATALPMILVYPLLQKYYIRGIAIGAIKG